MGDTAQHNGPGAPNGALSWRAPAHVHSIRELRDHARAYSVAHGMDDETASRLAVIVSEAATNAVMHAFVDEEPGTITLTCAAGPGELVVVVSDDGAGMGFRPDSPGMGLGLSMMGRLADRLDIGPGPSGRGTTVRLAMLAPGIHVGSEPDGAAELLRGASALARGSSWPAAGVEGLNALAVPAFADVACLDIVAHGTLRRVGALVHGDEELAERLRTLAPPVKPGTSTWAALQGEGPTLVVHDPAMVRPPGGPGALLGLEWWLTLPLPDAEGRVLALWGIGGRGERPPPPPDTQRLMAEAAVRAAPGIAPAQLIAGAHRTQQRLVQVVSAMSAAVTVADAGGVIVYANDAAARLHGLPGPAALVGTPVGARPVAGGHALSAVRVTTQLLEDPDGPLQVTIVDRLV